MGADIKFDTSHQIICNVQPAILRWFIAPISIFKTITNVVDVEFKF